MGFRAWGLAFRAYRVYLEAMELQVSDRKGLVTTFATLVGLAGAA